MEGNVEGADNQSSTNKRLLKTFMRLQLSIKAELENVTNLQPADENFEFFFKVKCTHCNVIHPKTVSMNRIDEWETSGGRNSKANFVWKCGNCKRENSASFESPHVVPYNDENAQFAPLLVLDCHGLEFIHFNPKGVWTCTGTSGTVFSEVDLTSDGDWIDYDEKASVAVRVFNIESRFGRGNKEFITKSHRSS